MRSFPVPAWLNLGDKRRSFHWGLGPVLSDFARAFKKAGLDRLLEENEVELFSFDLGPAALRHQSILPLSPPLGRPAIYRRTEKALKMVRSFYSGPLAAENYNFYPTGLYHHVTEPDFMASYLREFGLGLVLDLAHAAVSAHNTGLKPEVYFEALPLERTVEIHVSRPWLPAGRGIMAVDDHGAPGEREWRWLNALLEGGRIPDSAVIFIEYYKDQGKLEAAQACLEQLSAINKKSSENVDKARCRL